MKRALIILLIPLGLILALLLGLFLYYFSVTFGAKLEPEKLALTDNSVAVFDAFDNRIETRSGESVRISTLPDYLPKAFVAVEDKRFYEHHGLDFRRMAKAAWKNLTSFSFREGASTISQQLVKNTHLSGEKTIRRKLTEIKLTRALEKNYTKNEILELYLNSIYFGHSAFGIGNAAYFYFGKEAKDLDPAESATLAALVKSPNRYSPFKDPEKCKARRDFVLSLMREQGYLTEDEFHDAKEKPLPEEPAKEQTNRYLESVFEELAQTFPDIGSEDSVKIYTYFEPELQKELESVKTESDCTLLVRSAETNGVKALHSTCGILKRLPASTIKPLAVYAPALEENLVSPATPVLDEKTDFGGYSPSNYDDIYGGYVSVRYALSHSANVPAVKLLNALGVEKAAAYLEKLGLPVLKEDQTLALALGGMREGFTLQALADAYAVFANQGYYTPSAFIRKIENGAGKELYRREETVKRKVFSEDVCALVNDMLRTAVKEGTAKKLKSLPYAVCAKTGTGGTDAGNVDVYTLAYTSRDVVAVWLGNRDNSPVDATGGGIPANLALNILNKLYENGAPPDFPPCEKVVKLALDREEYEQNHRLLLADPASPDYLSLSELFRSSSTPEGTSSSFSHPKIQKPLIKVKNGAVQLILCQTYYYDYEVKRECEGQVSVIYSGKYRKEIFDNSVQAGKTYTYTVTPFYQGIAGEPVVLPSVRIEPSGELPDRWWE